MSQADANRMGLAFVEESSFGVSPGTALKDLRFVSESLKQETETTSSSEIRSDRQVPDVIRTNLRAAGDLSLELSYKAYEEFIEAALLSADKTSEVTVDSADTAISASDTDNSFNHTTAWATNPAVGDWIEVRGFTEAANNGYFFVTAVTNTKITVSHGTLVTEAAGDSITIKVGQIMTNGTTARTFHIEKEFGDLSSEFVTLGGMMPDTLSLQVAVEAIITGSFGFLGKSEVGASSTSGTGTNTAAPTNDILNAIDHVQGIFENGATGLDVTSFSLALANNLRARSKIGTLGAISIGTGSVNVTGSLEAYFASKAVMDRYRNFSNTSIALVTEDGSGNATIFHMPRVRFTDGQQTAGGINTDIIAALEYTAFRDPTYDYTLRVVQFDA